MTVVINACRSASGSKDASNIAALLVKSGVKTAVGMSYNVLSRTAERFAKDFYEDFLAHDTSALVAVSNARRKIHLEPLRTTKFYTTVVLEDHLIPIVHCNAVDTSGNQHPWSIAIENNDLEVMYSLVGREGDILRLETLLSQPGKINVHLIGAPGVGKTALLEHSYIWWKSTGLYQHMVHLELDLPQYRNCSSVTLIRDIWKQLTNLTSQGSSDEVISALNSGSTLLILMAVTLRELGKLDKCEEQLQLTIEERGDNSKDDVIGVRIFACRAKLCDVKCDFEGAVANWKKVVEIMRRIEGYQKTVAAEMFFLELARACMKVGKFEEAEEAVLERIKELKVYEDRLTTGKKMKESFDLLEDIGKAKEGGHVQQSGKAVGHE